MERELTCIVCPNGCRLTVEGKEDSWQVSGNRCPRGERFAIGELTNPMRTVSSTVRTVFAGEPVLPVRVSSEIPKDRIFDVMGVINQILVRKPVARGEVLVSDILGLGVDLIATGEAGNGQL